MSDTFILRRVHRYPIWHACYEDRRELAMAFLRMQEHYESPKFAGKIFSLEEFSDWYASERGSFSYVQDWSGFNVPSTSVRAVIERFKDHSPEERRLFRRVRESSMLEHERFYLIGTRRGQGEAFAHEMRHGLFYCDENYRREVSEAVNKYGLAGLRRELLGGGYREEVMVDELQAYVMTSPTSELRMTKEVRALRRELKAIERRYFRP